MTSAHERDPAWGPPLGGDATDALTEVAPEPADPEELADDALLPPEASWAAGLPEQWEVAPDETRPPAPFEVARPPEPPPRPAEPEPPARPPEPAPLPPEPEPAPAPRPPEPAPAVPAMHHVIEVEDEPVAVEPAVVEEPVVEEPVVEEPLVDEVEDDPMIFRPEPPPLELAELAVPPAPVAPPAPVEAAAPAAAAAPAPDVAPEPLLRPHPGLDAEFVPRRERVTAGMVLFLLTVVVGVAMAGLVAAVILAVTLVVRRALGA